MRPKGPIAAWAGVILTAVQAAAEEEGLLKTAGLARSVAASVAGYDLNQVVARVLLEVDGEAGLSSRGPLARQVRRRELRQQIEDHLGLRHGTLGLIKEGSIAQAIAYERLLSLLVQRAATTPKG